MGAERPRRGARRHRLWSTNTKANGPLFRQFGTHAEVTAGRHAAVSTRRVRTSPTTNPTRVFPDMAQILAGNTNAATGTCPATPPAHQPAAGPAARRARHECFAEWLPTADYVGSAANPGVGWAGNTEPSLNFRFTARDLAPEGGGYAFGDVKLLLDTTSGPFRVTSKTATTAAAVGGRTETDLLDQQHERPLGQREDQPVDGRRADLPDGPRREHAQRRRRAR